MVSVFIYIHTLCMQTVNALVSMCIFAYLTEPSLLFKSTITNISYAGSFAPQHSSIIDIELNKRPKT